MFTTKPCESSTMRTALLLLAVWISSISSFPLYSLSYRSARLLLASSEPEAETQSAERVGEDNDRANTTPEEHDVISAMEGPSKRTRQDGDWVNRTLHDICTEYSVPVNYLAEVLVDWGVPTPFNRYQRLGDLVTRGQACAILRAVNSVDNKAELQDRYSDMTFEAFLYEYGLKEADVLPFIEKEGWELPFGGITFLRKDQERRLLRVFMNPDSRSFYG